MINLPNPFLTDATSRSAETAAATSVPPDAAAGPIIESSITMEDIREAPAVAEEPATAGATDDIDCIGEIFAHARKLMADDDSYGVGPCMTNDLPIIRADNERVRRAIEKFERDHRFVLDQRAFEEALEEPPMFLQAMSA